MILTRTMMAGSMPPCTVIKKVPTGMVNCHCSRRAVTFLLGGY